MSLWREGSDYGLGLSKIEGSSLHGEGGSRIKGKKQGGFQVSLDLLFLSLEYSPDANIFK